MCAQRLPFRVTFVCTGNICRSPAAEWVVRQHVEDAGLRDLVEVDSSGTGGWHVGDPADHRTVAALRRRGYPSQHAARQFDPAWFAHYDLVIALAGDHLQELHTLAPDMRARAKVRLLREFDPAAAGATDLGVPDPYYEGQEAFELMMDLVEAAAPGLVAHIRAGLEGAGTRS